MTFKVTIAKKKDFFEQYKTALGCGELYFDENDFLIAEYDSEEQAEQKLGAYRKAFAVAQAQAKMKTTVSRFNPFSKKGGRK